jgi:hypothetical protein
MFFLYQLVNLVLETCLIFSKILKLGKTCFCLEFLMGFDESNGEHYDIPIPDYFFGIVFKKVLFLEFYKVNCGVNIGFSDTSLSERCFKLLTCKGNHDFLSLGRHVENVFYLKDFMTWLSL